MAEGGFSRTRDLTPGVITVMLIFVCSASLKALSQGLLAVIWMRESLGHREAL